ncbi:MAG: hypothetical protein QOD99_35, partial [Chthoniobacter sp.]|nr:hypothetical protein [Chthoniobacter sp.]
MKTITSSIEPLEARIAPATFIVTNLTDADPGSLRDMLAQADTRSGSDTIIFHLPAPPVHSENVIKLTGGELTSLGNVIIKGPGAGKLIIDGQNAHRIFHLDDTAATTDSPV